MVKLDQRREEQFLTQQIEPTQNIKIDNFVVNGYHL